MPKEYINPASLFASLKYGFSQIVTSTSGRTVYLSGQTPFDVEACSEISFELNYHLFVFFRL